MVCCAALSLALTHRFRFPILISDDASLVADTFEVVALWNLEIKLNEMKRNREWL